MADRLGKKMPNTGKFALLHPKTSADANNVTVQIRASWFILVVDINSGEGFTLKRSLAERLGRVVAEEESSGPPQKGELCERSLLFTEYHL